MVIFKGDSFPKLGLPHMHRLITRLLKIECTAHLNILLSGNSLHYCDLESLASLLPQSLSLQSEPPHISLP